MHQFLDISQQPNNMVVKVHKVGCETKIGNGRRKPHESDLDTGETLLRLFYIISEHKVMFHSRFCEQKSTELSRGHGSTSCEGCFVSRMLKGRHPNCQTVDWMFCIRLSPNMHLEYDVGVCHNLAMQACPGGSMRLLKAVEEQQPCACAYICLCLETHVSFSLANQHLQPVDQYVATKCRRGVGRAHGVPQTPVSTAIWLPTSTRVLPYCRLSDANL